MKPTDLDGAPERNLYLSDIDPAACMDIIQEIHKINAFDDKQAEAYIDYERTPIKIQINSYGGSIYDGIAVCDAIDKSQTPIHTHVSHAMSMGFIISLFGHDRTCSKYATFMWHSMSSGIIGKLQDMEEDMEENNRLQEIMNNITLERTKLKKTQLTKIVKAKRDNYIVADDALKLGIVDRIV
jgi:ATP-dependent Clp protease protease subunit